MHEKAFIGILSLNDSLLKFPVKSSVTPLVSNFFVQEYF